MSSQRLIFVHIPKTAGSSMKDVLVRQYGARLRDVHDEDAHIQRQNIQHILDLSDAQQAKIGCIVGHIPYGLHVHLKGAWVYSVILRHPLKRIVSNYHHVQHSVRGYPAQGTSFESYAQRAGNDSMQIRYVLGMMREDNMRVDRDSPLPSDALDRAKDALSNQYAAVGLTERFDESMLLFAQAFGWKQPLYLRQNVGTPSQQPISAESLATVTEMLHMEMALYDYAKTLFEERLAAYQGDLAADLARYQQANQRLAQANALRTLPYRTARSVYRKVKKLTRK